MTPAPPVRFSYDAEAAIRTATYTGTIDDASLVQAYRELVTQPGFDPLAHDLADLRLMAGDPARPRPDVVAGLAIVAATPVAFGLARMYELLTQDRLPKDTRVFRDFDEATRWLRTRPRLGGAGTR